MAKQRKATTVTKQPYRPSASSTAKSGYRQEDIDLALERGAMSLEGGFPWSALLPLIPLVAPAVQPIAEGVGKRIGKWIGGGLYPDAEGEGLHSGLATRGAGLHRTGSNFRVIGPHRGADAAVPTLVGSNSFQPKNVDRYSSNVGGRANTRNISIMKTHLEPYVQNPEAFRQKLTELVNGAGLQRVRGGYRAMPSFASEGGYFSEPEAPVTVQKKAYKKKSKK